MKTAVLTYADAGPEEPAVEEGELFDCQLPHGRSVYRFEHTKRPRREGKYLVAVSGIVMLRRIEAQAGGKVDLVNDTCRGGQAVEDRTTVKIDDPSVKWLGRLEAKMIAAGHGEPRVTVSGKEAGYGPDYDPFGFWT